MWYVRVMFVGIDIYLKAGATVSIIGYHVKDRRLKPLEGLIITKLYYFFYKVVLYKNVLYKK